MRELKNSEPLADFARGGGLVERVEMDAGNALIEKIGALLCGVVQADLAKRFAGVACALQGLEKTPRKTGAACEFGHSAHRRLAGHWHDAGNDGHINACQRAPLAKVVEVVVM